jgi:predicted O-methyltransferase YrrM
MSLWKKVALRRRARSKQESDAPVLTAEESASFAAESELYGLHDPDTLDGLGLMKTLMIYRCRPISKYLSSIGRRYSMLHPDVLVLLYYLAGHLRGDILEIGPYIGGSTIAEAKGVRDSANGKTIVTVELGGELTHGKLPSRDIVADLKNNLTRNSVADLVQVIVGAATAKKTGDAVRRHLQPGSVGLLVMDADGAVKNALETYEDLLSDDCWVVIDDYFALGVATKKAHRSKTEIDSLVSAGVLEPMGFYGWGTWIGRWHRVARTERPR